MNMLGNVNSSARRRTIAAALGLMTFGAAAQAPAVASSASPAPAAPSNVMNLSASATAEVAMDLLAITFSTTREGVDAGAVQSQLKQALDAALTEARKLARPGQVDIQTGQFSLYPRYSNKGQINGWQGSVQLLVEGQDMTGISQLAGRINTLSIAQVRHGLSRERREQVEAETTAKAIARFRERAQAHAQLFGFTGYALREVNVNTEGAPGVHPPVAMAMRVAAAPVAEEALPVQAGKTTLSATVNGSVVMTR